MIALVCFVQVSVHPNDKKHKQTDSLLFTCICNINPQYNGGEWNDVWWRVEKVLKHFKIQRHLCFQKHYFWRSRMKFCLHLLYLGCSKKKKSETFRDLRTDVLLVWFQTFQITAHILSVLRYSNRSGVLTAVSSNWSNIWIIDWNQHCLSQQRPLQKLSTSPNNISQSPSPNSPVCVSSKWLTHAVGTAQMGNVLWDYIWTTRL